MGKAHIMNKSNEHNQEPMEETEKGLSEMAGEQPESEDTPQRVGRTLPEKTARTIGQQRANNRAEMIEECAPDGAFSEMAVGRVFRMDKIQGDIAVDGTEIYSFEGVPFLEISPPVITNTKSDSMHVIMAVYKYKKLGS